MKLVYSLGSFTVAPQQGFWDSSSKKQLFVCAPVKTKNENLKSGLAQFIPEAQLLKEQQKNEVKKTYGVIRICTIWQLLKLESKVISVAS